VAAGSPRRLRADFRARHLPRRSGRAGRRRAQHSISQGEYVRLLAVQPCAELRRLMRLSRAIARCIVVMAMSTIGFASAEEAPKDDDVGVLTTPDGGEITIAFADLPYSGVGRFVWNDGRSYAGDFVDGHPQGRGI